MPRPQLLSSVFMTTALVFAVAGCSNTSDTPQGETGSLSLDLVIGDGTVINEVDWEITGGDMEPMSGTIDTGAPGSTASVEVFGLPPSVGKDYTITMEATATDGETTCRGSEDFGIDIGAVTDIMVMLNCKRPERLGAVRVNGEFNICAELAKVVVSPLQTSVGNDIDLSALGEDAEGDDITYVWNATGGSIDDSSAPQTTYTCEEVGKHAIMILVTDNDEYCDMATWTVPVTCVEGDGLECVDDEDCDKGEVCNDNNQCVPEVECNENEDCDTGEICLDNKCLPDVECNDDQDCDTGFVCENFECVPDVECNDDQDCDAGFVCENFECVPDVECNDDQDCDTGFVCENFECVPDVECNENDDCEPGDICLDNVCRSDPDLFCDTALCVEDDGLRADCVGAFLACLADNVDEEECVALSILICTECNTGLDCGDDNECTDNVCTAGVCSNPNNDNMCDGGAGTCNEGVCEAAPIACEYAQDFELLVPGDPPQPVPNSLSVDGWLVGANVFAPDGTTFLYDYFAFPAPNGGPAFSAVAVGEGGLAQGAQQLSIYNDYNNGDHTNGTGNIIEAIVFRERTIVAGDVGTTLTFTFDAKRGNIEGATTALAFVKTLDPGANFATIDFITEDTTNLPDTWGTFTLSLPIDASKVGYILQYGFQSRASNSEGSGIFYDNLTLGPEGCSGDNGGGVSGDIAINGGFETGAFNDGSPDASWQQFPGGGIQAIITDNPSAGTYAANLNVPVRVQGDGPVDNLIKNANLEAGNLTPGQSITVTWDMRGSLSGAGGVVFVELFSELSGGGTSKAEIYTNAPLNPAADWESFSWTTTLGSDVNGGVTLQLKAACGPVEGCGVDVYFDNVTITVP